MPVTSPEKELKTSIARMKSSAQPIDAAKAGRWAQRLSQQVQKVLKAHPEADPDNVRHTLIFCWSCLHWSACEEV
jgi:hypothetical protein